MNCTGEGSNVSCPYNAEGKDIIWRISSTGGTPTRWSAQLEKVYAGRSVDNQGSKAAFIDTDLGGVNLFVRLSTASTNSTLVKKLDYQLSSPGSNPYCSHQAIKMSADGNWWHSVTLRAIHELNL